jgi:hypothetical protein
MSRGAGCRGSLAACWWRVQIMIRGRWGAGWIHAGAAACGLRRMVQVVQAGNGCMAGSTVCQRAAAWCGLSWSDGAGCRRPGRARARCAVGMPRAGGYHGRVTASASSLS